MRDTKRYVKFVKERCARLVVVIPLKQEKVDFNEMTEFMVAKTKRKGDRTAVVMTVFTVMSALIFFFAIMKSGLLSSIQQSPSDVVREGARLGVAPLNRTDSHTIHSHPIPVDDNSIRPSMSSSLKSTLKSEALMRNERTS